MNTQLNKSLILYCLSLVLIFTGCKKDYKTTTKINTDGTCERSFVVTSDSGKIYNSVLPLPFDSTWQINWKKDTTGSDYIFTAKKNFNSFDQLSNLYEKINNPDKLKIHLKIEKNFRWFYTYYYYTEKYDVFNLFNKVPVSKYLTQQEIQVYLSGKENDTLKAKIKAWEERNYLEDFIESISNAAGKLNDSSITPQRIVSKKNELLKILNGKDMSNEKLLAEMKNIFKTNAVYGLKDDIDKSIKKIMEKAERMYDAEGSYFNSVLMPGLLISTNADKVQGSKVSWEFSSDRFTIRSLEMNAESRVMNTWAVIISSVVVLLILVLILLPAIKNRRTNL